MAAALTRQFALALRVRDRITEITEAAQRVEDLQSQLDQRVSRTKGGVRQAGSLDQPMKLYNQFLTMNAQVQSGDYEPTTQHGENVHFLLRQSWPANCGRCRVWRTPISRPSIGYWPRCSCRPCG